MSGKAIGTGFYDRNGMLATDVTYKLQMHNSCNGLNQDGAEHSGIWKVSNPWDVYSIYFRVG